MDLLGFIFFIQRLGRKNEQQCFVINQSWWGTEQKPVFTGSSSLQHERRGGKSVKSYKSGRIRATQSLLAVTGLLDPWTHSPCGCLHKNYLANNSLWSLDFPTLNNLYARWEKESDFLSRVTPDTLSNSNVWPYNYARWPGQIRSHGVLKRTQSRT